MKVSQGKYMTNGVFYLKVVSKSIQTFVALTNEYCDSIVTKRLGLLIQNVCNTLLHVIFRHESGSIEYTRADNGEDQELLCELNRD